METDQSLTKSLKKVCTLGSFGWEDPFCAWTVPYHGCESQDKLKGEIKLRPKVTLVFASRQDIQYGNQPHIPGVTTSSRCCTMYIPLN